MTTGESWNDDGLMTRTFAKKICDLSEISQTIETLDLARFRFKNSDNDMIHKLTHDYFVDS